ncbi:MAG: hypothetical protein AB1540_06670 [Bdellovibrionota bacterium]
MKTSFFARAVVLTSCTFLLAATGCSTGKKSTTELSSATFETAQQLWNTSESVQAPESAFYDSGTGHIYVSNVAGSPFEKDGKGWISKLDASGNIVEAQWATGFHAPKGLRAFQDTLWVSDIDRLVSIDLNSGKITRKVRIKGAKFLNDVAVGPSGEVYVSDTLTSRIHVVKRGKVSTFLKGSNLESPNGLLVSNGKLIVAGWGTGVKKDLSSKQPGDLFSVDLKTKKVTKITQSPLGNLDGLEQLPSGDFLVSDWVAGKVYTVTASGQVKTLLEGFKGSADIGFVPSTQTLLVPRMMENQVSAYSISK